jgi:SAM-dependent methyltransferase
MVMGDTLGFDSGSFDAIISVGVLTVGHAPARSLDELVRITRPGGYVVFSLRPDVYESAGFSAGFKEKQAELESAGRWKLIEEGEEFQPLPKGEPDVRHQVWVYQVCP